MDFAVLGAGPTGLGAAWRLSQRGRLRYSLIDESAEPGGRATSVTTPEGFTFDYGGHVLFPHPEYAELMQLLDRAVSAWHESIPIRGVWIDGRIIPTPVQRNIHRLPPRTLASCLWGLWRRLPASAAAGEPSLHEYLEANFGKQLTRHVMGPLNEKMWARPAREIGSYWSSHRSGSKEKNIADVKIGRLLQNFALRRDEPGWTEATRVRYPLEGGTGQIWRRVFDLLPQESQRLKARVVAVDAGRKCLYMHDGSVVRYERLVTSIPLSSLLSLLADEPGLASRASQFAAARVQIFGFGLRGPQPDFLRGFHALNIPSPDIPFWRVNLPAHFSPGNVPQIPGTWSILCESSLPAAAVCHSKQEIEAALRLLGFIPRETVVVSEFRACLEHGYPVPFLGRDRLLNEVQGKLESLGIYSRGRFGGWRYEVSNQDHAFMQGVEVVDRLLSGTPEYTYRKTW